MDSTHGLWGEICWDGVSFNAELSGRLELEKKIGQSTEEIVDVSIGISHEKELSPSLCKDYGKKTLMSNIISQMTDAKQSIAAASPLNIRSSEDQFQDIDDSFWTAPKEWDQWFTNQPPVDVAESFDLSDFEAHYTTPNELALSLGYRDVAHMEQELKISTADLEYLSFKETNDIILLKERGIANEGVCAKVKLELKQTAVLTRDAFDAQLMLENGTEDSLSHCAIDIIITDEFGNNVTDMFGIYPPTLTGFTGGSSDLGSLPGKSTGTANWIFIPGADCAIGKETVYYVGGFLRYTENGQELTFPLTSVAITVYPQPELDLDYFWQRDVYADDPWTEEIEPSIPFELAVMVHNKGGGVAQNLRIESAQPEIVENEKGLLIDFKIIASQVAGQNMTPSLNVNFGDIDAGQTSIATWLMTSTLQGQFTDLKVSFTHVNGFGNPKMAFIRLPSNRTEFVTARKTRSSAQK